MRMPLAIVGERRNSYDGKARLLKRIDDLQSLIGKIRRGEHS